MAGTVICRRRHCDGCAHRWTTLERIEGETPAGAVERAIGLVGQLRAIAATLEAWARR